METILLKIGYGIVLIGTFIIRYPYQKRNKANQVIAHKKGTAEKILLAPVFIGIMVLPLVYTFSGLFSFADYNLPFSLQLTGWLLIFPMLWLFYRAHRDLGQNWSVTLEIREGHTIVDSGVYKFLRHPMYSAIWLWAVIQALLLNNYMAGLSGLISFGLLYALRVKKEEKMMLLEFGAAYEKYMKRTKRIIPFIM